jgi:hypothetical protein
LALSRDGYIVSRVKKYMPLGPPPDTKNELLRTFPRRSSENIPSTHSGE